MVSKLMAFFECDGIINNDNNNNNNEQEKLDQNNKSSIIGQIQLSYTNTDNNNYYYYCHCGEYELNVTKNRKLNHLPEVKISAPATLSVATTHTNNTFLYVRYLLFVIIGLIIMIEMTIASDTSTTATTTTSPFVTSVLSVSYSSASPLTLCTMINSSSSNISCNSINDDDYNKSLKPSSSSSSANNNDIVLNLLLEKPIGTTHSPPTFTKITASTKNIISNIENNFTTMTTTPYPLWQQKNNKNEDKYERPTIIKTILTTISSPTLSLLSFRPSSNTINSSSHSLSSLQLKKATTKDQMLNNPTGLKNNMTFIVVSDIINLETTMSPFSQMISRSKLLSNENEWNDEQKIHNITTTMSTTLINTNNVTLSKKSENSDNILSNNNTIMTGTEMIKNIIIEQNLKEKSVQIDHNQISKLNNFIVNPTILPEVSVIGNDNSDEVDDEIMMIMPSSSYMHRIHRRRHLNNDFNDTIQIINHNVSDLNIVVNNDYHYNKMIIKNIQPVQLDTITNQTKLSINRLIDGKMLLKFNDYNQTKNWNKLNFNEKLLNESEQMIMLSDATHTNSNSTNNNFLQQHNIYRYYSQRQENDLKTLLSRYPSLRLPPPPPEFADDFDPGLTNIFFYFHSILFQFDFELITVK